MDHPAQSLRIAFRRIRRTPAFAIAVVLSLALGIGANSAMFTILDAVLLRPLPYSRSADLVAPSIGGTGVVFDSYFLGWAASTRTLTAMAEYNTVKVVVGGAAAPEEIRAAIASPALIQVFDVKPALGRFITAEDGLAGAAPVAVLGHDLWQRLFSGDPKILGRAVTINDVPTTVVGVMPMGFAFPLGTLLWQPRPPLDPRPGANGRLGQAVGRRRPGVSLAQVRDDLARVARPADMQRALSFRDAPVVVTSLHDELFGSAKLAVELLFAAVAVLLLVACANVASLVLARTLGRRQELAVRAALGASRVVLYWEVVIECVLLSLTAGGLGAILSVLLSRAFIRLNPAGFANVDKIGVNGRVLLFTIGISVLTAFVISSWPALKIANAGVQPLSGESGSRASSGRVSHFVRRTLVVVQLSATVVLLIGAGLLVKSLVRLATQNNGFEPHQLLIVTVNFASPRYRGAGAAARASQVSEQLATRLTEMPGVRHVAQGPPPFAGSGSFYLVPATVESPGFRITVNDVGPEYFETYRIPVLAGRSISVSDDSAQRPVVVVNATAARMIASGGTAVGRSLDAVTIRGQHPAIIGVVADVPQHDVAIRPTPEAFTASKQDPNWPSPLAIRVAGDPDALAVSVQRAVREIDPALAVKAISMDDIIASSLAPHRFTALLLGAFAALAIGLAAVGLFGVIAYLVEQRTMEFGVRMALGAQHHHVLRLVLREGLMLTAVGAAVGATLGLALSHLLKSLLYEVQPTDAGVITTSVVVLSVITLVASYIPARRATRIDPIVALRAE